MAASEKTEEATPKKREDARNKGQVARSADLDGAVVLLAGLGALGALGPKLVARMEDVLRASLSLGAVAPRVVERQAIGAVVVDLAAAGALSVAPIALACVLAGVAVNVAQVRFRITPAAMQPSPGKLNPLNGFKQIFGPNAAVEGVKSVVKVAVVAAIAASALVPALPELAMLVGIGPQELGRRLAGMVLGIAKRAAIAYLLLGCADYLWQRRRHEKSLKMDKEEVEEEQKGQALPAEVRSAQRRRAAQLSRGRMMDAVPEADVVVTNPTHFSVALKYGSGMLAPEVVAKGQDLAALKIREIAAQHGVPIVPNPPLARGLYASVEVGQAIPEELFQAVAQVLAYVYRIANRRLAA